MPKKTPIEPGLIARVTGAWKVITGQSQPVVDDGSAYFGPSNPMTPQLSPAQDESARGRAFDFPAAYNTRQTVRSGEAVTFAQMRALADGCDVLRLVIETRKDQLSKMTFKIAPKEKPKTKDAKLDARAVAVQEFLQSPDGENDWDTWSRMLLEEMFVTDAATIYPWMTNGGNPYRFELVDGATIKRVLDIRGRTPAAPMPAYQQVLKGIPAVDYTTDELIYKPRNKRVNRVYGYSPVEQIIMTVNIAIRRSLHQLQYYTKGSTPDLMFQVPPDWNMAQIKEFNDWWNDTLSGNTGARRRAQFVPNGVAPLNTKDGILKDAYDEWLARIVCYAFSVSAQPFIKENNRSTAETAMKAAMEEGLMPVMKWVKSVMDIILWKYFGYTDLEFVWEADEATDANIQDQMDDRRLKNGTATVNEIRASRGDSALEGGDDPMVLTATGYVPLIAPEPEPVPPALAAAGALGATLPGAPVPPAVGGAPQAGEGDNPAAKLDGPVKKLDDDARRSLRRRFKY